MYLFQTLENPLEAAMLATAVVRVMVHTTEMINLTGLTNPDGIFKARGAGRAAIDWLL